MDNPYVELTEANEERLARYISASRAWSEIWPEISKKIAGWPLAEAHAQVTERAEGVLPFEP